MIPFVKRLNEEILQECLKRDLGPDLSIEIATAVEESIRRSHGGIEHYIHGIDMQKRNRQIMAEFDGRNYANLARKMGLSQRMIRNIITAEYARLRPAP